MLILRADLHVDFTVQQKTTSKETAFLRDKEKKVYSILNYKYLINN